MIKKMIEARSNGGKKREKVNGFIQLKTGLLYAKSKQKEIDKDEYKRD